MHRGRAMNLLGIRIVAGLLVLGALVWLYRGFAEGLREEGRAEVRAEWQIARNAQQDAALAEAAQNAEETKRRLAAQEENQRVQDAELARARADAARNAADADRVRKQAADAARDWSARLRDSPTGEDLTAAAAAITVLTDVRGRLDAAASELAGYATAARAAGLKCERDYDSLTKR